MSPGWRKFVLAAHVTSTVGWIGAVLVFIALAVLGLTSRDAQTVRGVYLVMEPTAWWVLIPLATASMLTGIVQSVGTRWGLFRHYWVVIKFGIAVLAILVLLQYMETFRSLARTASSSDELDMVRNPSPLGHAVIALLLLLVATVLSVYKPRGVTRYEQYKQRARPRPAQAPTAVVTNRLALVGLVGPIVFVVVLLAQDLLRSDYDPLAAGTADPMIGSYGWVQQANFIVLGLALIGFALGLHRAVRVAGPSVLAPAIVAVSGLGLIVAAAFPLTDDASDLVVAVRDVNNTIFGLSVGVGFVVMAWRMARDARWRGLADYTLATGIAWLAMARLANALLQSGEAPYGLMRRAMLAVWLSCIAVLAVRLRRVAHADRVDMRAPAVIAAEDRVPTPSGVEAM